MTISQKLEEKLSETRLRKALLQSMRQTMTDLMTESIKEAPPNTDYRKDKSKPRKATGNLARSHSIDVLVGRDMLEGVLKNSANYWTYVQYGTSRMNANDFVTRALSKVAPAEKCSEYFKQKYKE
jgi:HK97 gp10 family phage protein